jgi:hypothetical protein
MEEHQIEHEDIHAILDRLDAGRIFADKCLEAR